MILFMGASGQAKIGTLYKVKRYAHKRSQCRRATSIFSTIFFAFLLVSPFIVFGDDKTVQETSLFGLHPDTARLAFLGLFSLAVWLLKRAIDANTKSQNTLHANQRMLASILTQLITQHNMNHKSELEIPKLEGSDESEK